MFFVLFVFFIIVAEAPTDLSTFRESIASLSIDWMPPFVNATSMYSVYINGSDGFTNSTNTDSTFITFASLRPEVSYTIRLVAVGNENLPSSILTETSPAG